MDEWSELTLNEFKIYLEQLGRARRTVSTYSGSVRLFFSLYEKLSITHLKEYRDHLIGHYEINTVNIRVYGMNQFLGFLSKRELLPEDFTEEGIYRMQPVKAQKKTYLDTVISQRDYEKLKRRLKKDGDLYWYFVVRFLGSTGARVSELLQIKIEDLHAGYLDLYSKGGKIRRLYFPRVLCLEAIPWFAERGIWSGFIFLNKHGKLITPRGIELQLKQLARRYKINPDTVYPHSFRHRFAKNFLKKFNDITLLADLLGHDSIETTRIYLTRSSQEQKALLDRIIIW